MAAPQQFPRFAQLPAELRIMVWVASIEPRIVDVNMVHRGRPRAGRSRISWRVSYPAQLRVSVEARQVLIRLYMRLPVACPVAVGGAVAPPQPVVYFHPGVDVLAQDFEVIIEGELADRVRRPGVRIRLPLRGDFDDIFRRLQPIPQGFVDPFHHLGHLHLNLHILRSSRRNPANNDLRSTVSFVSALLNSRTPNVLQSITTKVTIDLSRPPAAPQPHSRRPFVYRIVPNPSVPIAQPNLVFSDIRRGMIPAVPGGQPPAWPHFVGTLLADAAIFTTLRPGGFIALRVIDPRSIGSYFDDAGGYWFGPQRESLWRHMLGAGEAIAGPVDVAGWLTDLIADPRLPCTESPWGICGVNYGMGQARVYSNPTDTVDWNWQ